MSPDHTYESGVDSRRGQRSRGRGHGGPVRVTAGLANEDEPAGEDIPEVADWFWPS